MYSLDSMAVCVKRLEACRVCALGLGTWKASLSSFACVLFMLLFSLMFTCFTVSFWSVRSKGKGV